MGEASLLRSCILPTGQDRDRGSICPTWTDRERFVGVVWFEGGRGGGAWGNLTFVVFPQLIRNRLMIYPNLLRNLSLTLSLFLQLLNLQDFLLRKPLLFQALGLPSLNGSFRNSQDQRRYARRCVLGSAEIRRWASEQK